MSIKSASENLLYNFLMPITKILISWLPVMIVFTYWILKVSAEKYETLH